MWKQNQMQHIKNQSEITTGTNMQPEKTLGSSPGGIQEEIAFDFKSWELCLFEAKDDIIV